MRSMFSCLVVLLGFLLSLVHAETKHYALVVTEEVIYPDCVPRLSLVVNGTFPGPALYATAGDHIFIRVYNSASSDNLTMHWHGISQYGSPFADGTPYASQWPIPAGKYFDYEFQFEDDLDGTFWYHSHIGTQSLTCHGALIILPKCRNPADCPCTHVNCGRGGDQVWDPIAGDWSPTIGIDVTVNVNVNFPGGSVSVTDSTSVYYSNGNGGKSGSGSSSEVGTSPDSLNTGVSSSSGSNIYSSSSSSSLSGSGLGSLSSGSSSSEVLGASDTSSDDHKCCKCKYKSGSKKTTRKTRRHLSARGGDSASTPPYAFDTSCSKSPIPYDEERIIILEDAYYNRDSTLSATALNGQFIGGANNFLLNGKQFFSLQPNNCNRTGLWGTMWKFLFFCKCRDRAWKDISSESFIGFSIAGHKMQIVQVDGGSWIQPYEADYVLVHAGQRYAVIIEGKSESELAAYGKDYYYMQMQDYQNPPPPTQNNVRPSGPLSASGAPSSAVVPQSAVSAAASDPGENPASLSTTDFAAQETIPSEPSVRSPPFSAADLHDIVATATESSMMSKETSTQATQNTPTFSDMTTGSQNSQSDSSNLAKRQGPSGGPPGGGPPGGGPGGPPRPPSVVTGAYAVLTYKTSSGGNIPQMVFTTVPNNQTDDIPILPNSTVGASYQNVTNQFRPYYSNPAPTPNKRIFLNNTAENWSGKERDVLNNLAFYPNPAQVPLLVGMYNGQVVVDQATQVRAAAQGNYFDNTTGAYLLEVGDVVEIILQNQVGTNNVVIHPFHMHGGDFWDMGGGDGEFSDETYQELLSTVDPIKRDTTLLSALPASRGTTGNPQGFRVWRWEAKAKGA